MKSLLLAIALMLCCVSCDELIAVYEEPIEPTRAELIDTITIKAPDREPEADTIWVSPGSPIQFGVTVTDYNEA